MYIYMLTLLYTAQYIRINSGTCETNGMVTITTEGRCQAALNFLGLGERLSYSREYSSVPYGCIFRPRDRISFLNSLNSNNPACGSPEGNIYDCICSNSGMNSQFNYGPFLTVYIIICLLIY